MRLPVELAVRSVGVVALTTALVVSIWNAWRGGTAAMAAPLPVLPLMTTAATADTTVARAVRDRIVQAAVRQARANPAHDAAVLPSVQVTVSAIPHLAVRRVLGAARAAGVSMQWENATALRAFAGHAVRTASPDSAVDVMASVQFDSSSVAAARAASTAAARHAMVVTDSGGVLDSLALTSSASSRHSGNLRLRVASLAAPAGVRVWSDDHLIVNTAFSPAPTPAVGRVRLYAQPGWESKFVMAALEESGWRVDASFFISPKAVAVRVGDPTTLDTTRYAAAVVLDSGVVAARDLLRFVSQGGGVVVAGGALRDAAVRAMTAATIEDDRGAIAGALLTDTPRRGLPAFHLEAREGATVMEREGDEPTIVLVRRGVGRVMAVGYRETWHWRMEGRDEAADAFRRWWNGLLASVAYVGVAPPSTVSKTVSATVSPWPGSAAPVADMIAQLGAPARLSVVATPAVRSAFVARFVSLLPWLFATLIVGSLLVEWAMRRLRGAS